MFSIMFPGYLKALASLSEIFFEIFGDRSLPLLEISQRAGLPPPKKL